MSTARATRYSVRILCSVFLFAGFVLRTAPAAEDVTVSFGRDGGAILGNSLVSITAANRPGHAYGLVSWVFKPTQSEMIDVLYGQTDYVEGHVLGERWDRVELKGMVGGAPDCGGLYAPVAYGVAPDGSGLKVVQESRGSYLLRRTFVLRRDLATLEARYELTNLSSEPRSFSLRFHSAMSPGARGKYQKKDHVVYLATAEGVLALDQTLNNEQYHERYKNDKFFNASWADEPKRPWVWGKLPTPELTENWAAIVRPANGDGMAFVADESTLVGYYNCPGITLEPVFRATGPARGQTWKTSIFLSSFTGAKEQAIAHATPLYVAVVPLAWRDAKVSGQIIPLFNGAFRILNAQGKTVLEEEARANEPLALDCPVPENDWKAVAVDTKGALIGSVASSGKVELAEPEVRYQPPKRPVVRGQVYLAEQDRKAIGDFLREDGVRLYCDWEAKDETKRLAEKIARRFGLGLAWANPNGKLLVIGSPENAVIRDAGLLKHSICKDWPGAGKGAVLFYENFELTQEPLLLVAGSDAAGAAAACKKFSALFLAGVKQPEGFAFWPISTGGKVYPYDRPPKEGAAKVAIEIARGEYEAAQLVITAYDDLNGVDVSVAPLVHAETGKEMPRNYITRHRRINGPLWLRWVDYIPLDRKRGWAGFPDPLLERPVRNIPAGASQPLWLTVIVPESAPPGTYTSSVTCALGEEKKTIPVEVLVWDFVLPRDGLMGEPYMNFANFPPDNRRELVKRHVEALTRNLVEHGMRVIHLGPPEMFRWHFSPEAKYKGLELDWLAVSEDGMVAVDTSYFDWLVETCDAAAKPFDVRYMIYIQGLTGSAYGDFRRAFPKRFAEQPKREGHWYQGYYAQEMIGLLKEHLEARGWLDRFVLKISDEPRGFDWWYDRFTLAAREVGMPFMTCFNSIDWKSAERGLGKLAVWQPLYMHNNPEFFRKAREAGALISWYNCGPPPRIAMHATHSELRGYLWQAAKADLDIICWWGIQCWAGTDNLWRDRYSYWNSVVYPAHPDKPAWIKPGKSWVDSPPIDSIRWEMIRDGMEDAWYVNLLRRRIEAARQAGNTEAADKAQAVLDDVWEGAFPTLNDYAPPYETLLECRRRIAAAILSLPEK